MSQSNSKPSTKLFSSESWKAAVETWTPDPSWVRIQTLDAHTGGEPLRIYIDGFPEPAGSTVLQRRQDAKKRLEFYRTGTMWEPRGHADMYGCLVIPPERPDSHFGVLFLHNEGYSSMCGHGIIAISTVAVETGWFPADQTQVPINIDAPAGQIKSKVLLNDGVIQGVSFENVPSFSGPHDQTINVPDIGPVTFDLGFGGAYYAYVDADSIGLDLVPSCGPKIVDWGRKIKHAVMDSLEINHPLHRDLSFLYGTIFTSKPKDPNNHSRHCCVFADGEVDRSPTGTGVSGRAAILWDKKQLEMNQSIRIESILGTCFDVKVIAEKSCGNQKAVVPEVFGQAYITGKQEFYFDPADPLNQGFFIR